jgi:cysteinyl-tRNA synthetase
MRTVRLHDTHSGELKELRPREGRKVGIYACGPTVYGRIHVGNARPYVVFSLLARFLAHEGYEPVLVANITDINDKIYDAARPAAAPTSWPRR